MFTPYLNASNSYIRTARLMIYLKELLRDYRVEVNFTLDLPRIVLQMIPVTIKSARSFTDTASSRHHASCLTGDNRIINYYMNMIAQ